ncbi:MAG: PD40 domain-containing protein [Bacteroidales bacterium]|nr:PD40 domain-containing protein [Bacteroidales bacterium]MBN2762494.1 PD40 domain-containing protein [Bacteroidales bacterium]
MKMRIAIFTFLTILCTNGNIHAQKFFSVRKLPFNGPLTQEFAPAIYNNGIVFCSDRRNKILFRATDLLDYNNTNLYWSEQKKPGKFGNEQEFARELNTQYHEGSATFSKDGKTIYFTRSIDAAKKRGNSLRGDTALGIFSSEYINGEWTTPKQFPFSRLNINTNFPCLSEDGRQLFFCSTDPRGYGNYDIYVSEIVNGQPRNPVNLGPEINTPENDGYPFLHKSGRLYFSSRGHGGRGGLDIFYTEFINGEWQEPVALPDPFNTINDDFALVINETADTAYFTSNRGNSLDIYMAYSTLPVFADCPGQQQNDYCYTFYEAREMNLDTTLFNYEWNLGDGTIVRGLTADHCYATTGNYTVQLNVIDLVTGEIYYNEATYNLAVEDIVQPYITAVDTTYVGDEVQFSALKSNLDFTIDGYYWDFGDGTRAEDRDAIHYYRKPGIYNIQLGVTSAVTNEDEFPEKVCVVKKILVLPRNR